MTGPTRKERQIRMANIMDQQVVEVAISFLSLGANKPLYGLKCDPSFPGLLYHCSKTKEKIIYIVLKHNLK